MIEEVMFHNFKALRGVRIPLSPFTLIVGPNSSGKTSILEGLHYLAQLGKRPAGALFVNERHPDRLRTAGETAPMVLGLSGRWESDSGALQLVASPPDDDPEKGYWRFHTTPEWNGSESELDAPRQVEGGFEYNYKTKQDPLLRAVRSAVFLHFNLGRLIEPSYSEEITPRVEFDGGNLAATLADMAIAHHREYGLLLERLQRIVTPLKSFRLQKTPIASRDWEAVEEQSGEILYRPIKTKSVGYRILFDFVTGAELDAAQASEGTLLTLGLLTVLCGPSRPHLVLVDELERGLHPKALGVLVSQIREVMRQFPDLQVIGTTHSPYLVDHFDASEVVLTTLRDDGSVAVGALDKHPEFDRWKDEMKPGEFWSTVGEDWVDESKGTDGA